MFWESAGELVCSQSHLVSPFPNFQFTKILHSFLWLIANCYLLIARRRTVRMLRPRRRRPQRQLHMKRRPEIPYAAYADAAFVVAHYRLHDGQSQAGSVLLGGVIGREQAVALFLGQAFAGV